MPTPPGKKRAVRLHVLLQAGNLPPRRGPRRAQIVAGRIRSLDRRDDSATGAVLNARRGRLCRFCSRLRRGLLSRLDRHLFDGRRRGGRDRGAVIVGNRCPCTGGRQGDYRENRNGGHYWYIAWLLLQKSEKSYCFTCLMASSREAKIGQSFLSRMLSSTSQHLGRRAAHGGMAASIGGRVGEANEHANQLRTE